MRLRSLNIDNFRALRKVHLKFGPGLNVLFGPNDLGKSSLIDALRAAFLLPVTSKSSQEYVPWDTNDVPKVIVEFESRGVVWKITKMFASGRSGTARLDQIRSDGSSHKEENGKRVDGKLREILNWGIPETAIGLPISYLSTALLGSQDKVTAILETSLANDGDGTGRVLLTDVLGAIGQDPLVTKLLQQLEERYQDAFTPTGRIRANGLLDQCNQDLEARKGRLKDLEDKVRQSLEIEHTIQRLIEDRHALADKHSHCKQQVALFRAVHLLKVQQQLSKEVSLYEEAFSELRTLEEDLRKARDHHTVALTKLEAVRENIHQMREARRTELVARRDAAQTTINLCRQLQDRAAELDRARIEYERAKQEQDRAKKCANLAGLLQELQNAQDLDRRLADAGKEQERCETHQRQAKEELRLATEALDKAERALSLQACLAQEEETIIKIRHAMDGCHRTDEATRLLDSLSAEKQRLDEEIQENVAKKQAISARCQGLRSKSLPTLDWLNIVQKLENEIKRHRSTEPRTADLPLRRTLFAAVFSFTVMAAALKFGLQVENLLVLILSLGSGLVIAALTALFLRHRRSRRSGKVWRRELDQLDEQWKSEVKPWLRQVGVADLRELENVCRTTWNEIDENQQGLDHLDRNREALIEQRHQVLAQWGGARERVNMAQQQQAHSHAALGLGKIAGAQSLEQDTQSKIENIKKELRALGRPFTLDPRASAAEMIASCRETVKQKQQTLDDTQAPLAEAKWRTKTAENASAAVNRTDLEEKVKNARQALGEETGNSDLLPEEARARVQQAEQILAQRETDVRVSNERQREAHARFNELPSAIGRTVDQVLAEITMELQNADRTLEELDSPISDRVAEAETAVQNAHAAIQQVEKKHDVVKIQLDTATKNCDKVREECDAARRALEGLVTPGKVDEALLQAKTALDEDPIRFNNIPEILSQTEHELKKVQVELQRINNEHHQRRGQLSVVGGSVEKDRLDQEREALERHQENSLELELDCKAARRLLEVLKEEDKKHTDHLGKNLAKPVMQMFHEFTGDRYGMVELDPELRFQNIESKGGNRKHTELSVGTRDQLATLVRLAIAAHLKSVLLLDDHLTHGDPDRLAWFRDRLRASVREHEHQIIVTTCRPLDYLSSEEMPGTGSARFETADSKLVAVDLGRVISHE